MTIHRTNTIFKAAAALIALAAVLYCSWPLGFVLNPAAMRSGLASELGALHQPWNWLFIWADVASGVLLLAACSVLIRRLRLRGLSKVTLMLLAVYGVCGALDAILPERCLPSQQVCGPILHDPLLIAHGLFDIIGSIVLFVSLCTAGRFVQLYNRRWLPWIYAIGAGGTLFAVLSAVFLAFGGPGYWAQRYYITLSSVWVASVPIVLRVRAEKQQS